jgi:crossover junction endodeoxyribonuclease RuvC
MLVLGIDPGLATTGYGLVADDGPDLSLIDCGVLVTPPALPLGQRLYALHRQLADLIERHRPEAVAVEELFFSRNARTAMIVGHARGVILLTIAERGIPAFEYTPLQVKDAIVGYGRASKSQIQKTLRVFLGMEDYPRPDDAADAVAVAICHIHSARLASLLQDAGNTHRYCESPMPQAIDRS